MSAPKTRTFPELDGVCRAAAGRFAELAEAAASKGRTVSVAFSGGETPRKLFVILASAEYAGRIPWKRVQLFQVDERCVPPDDAQSNYRMAREGLLSRVPEAAAQFHRIMAERPDRDSVARDYEDELKRVLAPSAGQFPRFDLILLGMGEDGHTASLFPGSAALQETKRGVAPNFSPSLKSWRITLTFPVLNAAAEAIFLVAGAEKAERLKEVFEGPAGRYPAQRIQPMSGELWWYIDEGASRLLSAAKRNQR